MSATRWYRTLAPIAVFAALTAPLIWLALRVAEELQVPTSGLGADPGEAVVHFLGEWAIRILLLAFSVTPLYRWSGWTWVAQRRRMVGVFAFAYAFLHMTSYLFFYLQFDLAALSEEVLERPYITVGMAALLCLLPMAVTSTRGWQRRLRKRWRQLHRLVYPAVGLAIVHLWWLTRDGFGEVVVYAAWFAILLAARWWRRSQSA